WRCGPTASCAPFPSTRACAARPQPPACRSRTSIARRSLRMWKMRVAAGPTGRSATPGSAGSTLARQAGATSAGCQWVCATPRSAAEQPRRRVSFGTAALAVLLLAAGCGHPPPGEIPPPTETPAPEPEVPGGPAPSPEAAFQRGTAALEAGRYSDAIPDLYT